VAALAEQHQRRFTVAAKLWESVAAVLEQQSAEPGLIQAAFQQAISALEQEEESVDIRFLAKLFNHGSNS
jgi:hypothetical protein